MKHLLSFALLAATVSANLPGMAQVHASESPAPKPVAPVPEPVQPLDRGTPRPMAGTAGPGSLAESRVFRYEDMPLRTSANGSESRAVTNGILRSGETMNMHESMQPAGAEPVALHVIHHTEFICIQQGVVTFDHLDASGKQMSEQVGPGGVIYVAAETNHRVRNAGTEPAKYFVIAIGGDAK